MNYLVLIAYDMKKILQIKPLTVNRAWQGKRFKTQDYKDYEKEVFYSLKGIKKVSGFVEVNYRFNLIHFSTSDLGNFEKPLTDIIVKSGLIDDDRFILKMTMQKFKSDKNSIEIEILPANGISGK